MGPVIAKAPCLMVRVALRQPFGVENRYLDAPSFGAAAAAIPCGRGAILRFEWVDATALELSPSPEA